MPGEAFDHRRADIRRIRVLFPHRPPPVLPQDIHRRIPHPLRTRMRAGGITTRLPPAALRKPRRPILPDDRQKVLEEEILPLDAAEQMQAAVIRLLRKHDARVMLPEIEALE